MLFFLLANLTDDGLQACVENPDAFAEACDSVRVPHHPPNVNQTGNREGIKPSRCSLKPFKTP